MLIFSLTFCDFLLIKKEAIDSWMMNASKQINGGKNDSD